MKKKPQRMCIVCRNRKDKKDLLRVVLRPDGETEIDPSGKMPGRGAYVCNHPDCLARAGEAHRLERGLKAAVDVETKEQIKHCAEELELRGSDKMLTRYQGQEHQEKRVTEEGLHKFIGLAAKAGQVISGFDAVGQSLAKNRIRLIMIAKDASEGTIKKITREAEKKNIKYAIYSDKARLGSCLGQRPKAVIAITDEHFSSQLLLMMHRLEQSNHHDI